jgi:chaperonin GroES
VARSKNSGSSKSRNKGHSVGGKKAKPTPKVKSSAKAKPVLKAKPKTANRTAIASDSISTTAFKPIEDRVLIAVEEAGETTAGGIIIPGNVESRPHRGTVLAKGPGRRGKKGQIRPLDVNVGDHVLFPEHAGSKIQIGGDDFLILREDELLGIVTV